MALKMKYFVINPASKAGGDRYAMASRIAMRAYAEAIRETDPEMAEELWMWANMEEDKEHLLKMEKTICES